MGIQVVLGDITDLDVDCLVNAANSSLLGGGGVDGRIHQVAGIGLLKECISLNGCETGEAKITAGYSLKAKYVIHTVGPIYTGKEDNADLLSSCYTNSLTLAKKYNINSMAFPCISTGVYGYPKRQACAIAISAVTSFLEKENSKLEVIFCCYDRENFDIYRDELEKRAI